jgi:topoisomerase-4 subunit A
MQNKSELAKLVVLGHPIRRKRTVSLPQALPDCQLQLKMVNPLLPEGNFKLVKLSTYENAELTLTYKPKPGLRILEEKFYFSDYLVKSVKANGVRISVKEVASLKLRSVKEVVHANTAEPTLFDDENQEE